MIENASKNNTQLEKVEKFFNRAVFLHESDSDKELQRKLRQRVVADAEWNVDRLLSVEKEYDAERQRDKPFYHNCYVLNGQFQDALDTTTLVD